MSDKVTEALRSAMRALHEIAYGPAGEQATDWEDYANTLRAYARRALQEIDEEQKCGPAGVLPPHNVRGAEVSPEFAAFVTADAERVEHLLFGPPSEACGGRKEPDRDL